MLGVCWPGCPTGAAVMNIDEVTRILTITTPILTVVGGIFSAVIWLMRRHMRLLDEQIVQLRLRGENLEADVEEARAEALQERLLREDAQRRKQEADTALTEARGTLSRIRDERANALQ